MINLKCLSLTCSSGLLLAGMSCADIGNSIVFQDPEGERTVSLDRIHLATLSEREREAVLQGIGEELGEGQIADKSLPRGSFVLDTQQRASGGLVGKRLDVEFLPLGEEPDRVSGEEARVAEPGGMEKLGAPPEVYHVAAPGVWGKSYGGENWSTPAGGFYDSSKTECKGSQIHQYNSNWGHHALWDWEGRRSVYNVTLTRDNNFKEYKLGANGAKAEMKYGVNLNRNTRKQKWCLYSDRDFDYDDGIYPIGDLIAAYDEVSSSTAHSLFLECKVTVPYNELKIADATQKLSLEGGVYATVQTKVGYTLGTSSLDTRRKVDYFGYEEVSHAFTVDTAVGVEVKVKVLELEVKGAVQLGYKYTRGSAFGIRDFDYWCYEAYPQRYEHKGYNHHEIYLKKAFEAKIFGISVKVEIKNTLYSKTAPGRFYSTADGTLQNTAIDYQM